MAQFKAQKQKLTLKLDVIEGLEDAGEAEFLEDRDEFINGAHGSAPGEFEEDQAAADGCAAKTCAARPSASRSPSTR